MQALVTKGEIDRLSYSILGAAIEVHKTLGPGLLEGVYHKCMKEELRQRKLSFVSEFLIPLQYKGTSLEAELRCDLLVENTVVVELKSTDAIAPVFEAQLLTYMKLLDKPKGILINFNCTNIFKEGQRTFVNEYYSSLKE